MVVSAEDFQVFTQDVENILEGAGDIAGGLETIAQVVTRDGKRVRKIGGTDFDINASISVGFAGDQKSVPVKDIPLWMDVASGSDEWDTALAGNISWRHYILLYAVANGIRTEAQFNRIALLDPMSSIGGTQGSLAGLSLPQQKEYLARALVIGSAKTVKSDRAWPPVQLEIDGVGRSLGIELKDTRPEIGAFVRALAKGATSTTTIGGNGMSTATAQAALESCLGNPDFAQREMCVTDLLRAQPELATLFEGMARPWADVADPNKMLQLTVGLDGNRWVVLNAFGQKIGVKLPWVIAGAAAGAFTVIITTATGVYYLGFNKNGKKLRKKYLGF